MHTLTRLRRRRDPNQSADYLKETERRRAESSEAFKEKFAWQSDESVDPLIEFKRRQKEVSLHSTGCKPAVPASSRIIHLSRTLSRCSYYTLPG